MKKILRPLLAAVCAAALALCGGCGEQEQTYPDHTEEFYVNDFADVISDKDAEEMISAGAALDTAVAQVTGKEHGAQVVAVTVDTTDGEEISEYAFALGNSWGVGQEGEDNGVLILLATGDREVFVAVGDGLGGVLPDSKTGRFIDLYAGEYFSENEFSAGMLNLYRAIVREIYGEYAVPVPENVGEPQVYEDDISTKDVVFSWAGIAILALIFVFLTRKNVFFMPFGPNYRGPHGGFGGFGGFGGGSGGFGGFGGGGGGFGGGGAGRSF